MAGFWIAAALVAASSWIWVLYMAISLRWFNRALCAIRVGGPGRFPVISNIWHLSKMLKGIPLHYHRPTFKPQDMIQVFSQNGLPFHWIEDYPDMFRLWLGAVPIIIATSPATVKHVLGVKGPNPKSVLYKLIHPWLGTGLLTSSGEKWRARRRLITPTFHFQCLNGYFNSFTKEAVQLQSKILSIASTGKRFHIYPLITHATLDIIMECAFGQSMNAQRESDAPYVRAVYGMLQLVFDRILKPWQWPSLLFAILPSGIKTRKLCSILHSQTESVIEARRKNLPETPACFLDMLLMTKDENGEPIPPEGVREEVDTFMFEGHDTTSSAITTALYMLGCHPEVQRRAQQEIDEVLQGRIPTIEDTKNLVYLTAVVKESIRMIPPVPFIGRCVTEAFELNGAKIPAGVDIVVAPVVVHHNERVWESSWEFDPTRHTSKRADDRRAACLDSWALVPFSAGPRNCIGQQFAMLEMIVVLAVLLQKLTFRCPEDQEITLEVKLIMRPKNGHLLMTAEAR